MFSQQKIRIFQILVQDLIILQLFPVLFIIGSLDIQDAVFVRLQKGFHASILTPEVAADLRQEQTILIPVAQLLRLLTHYLDVSRPPCVRAVLICALLQEILESVAVDPHNGCVIGHLHKVSHPDHAACRQQDLSGAAKLGQTWLHTTFLCFAEAVFNKPAKRQCRCHKQRNDGRITVPDEFCLHG